MAVLGTNGKLAFNRSAPTPVAIDVVDLNQDKNIISLTTPGFRSGDLVEVASANNWPNASLTDSPLIPTYADTVGNALYYELVDHSTPYSAALLGSLTVPYKNHLYVHVDVLNRLSFYRTRSAALSGANDSTREDINRGDFASGTTTALELRLVNEWKLQMCLQDWTLSLNSNEIDTTGLGNQFSDGVKSLVRGGGSFDFLIEREAMDSRNTAIISESSYANARCFVDVDENILLKDADIIGTAGSIENYGPNYNDASLDPGVTAYDNANVTPRSEITTWTPRPLASVGTSNLLRLLLQANEQAEAEAEFWMIDGDSQGRTSYTGTLLPGDLYYKAQLIVTSSAVNVRATDIITGSASFVTVRDVELREG